MINAVQDIVGRIGYIVHLSSEGMLDPVLLGHPGSRELTKLDSYGPK